MQTSPEALREAERLVKLSDERLIEELGLRVHDAELPGGEDRARKFSADFRASAPDMAGGIEFLRDLGRRWWGKLEPDLVKIVCEQDNKDLKKLTAGSSIPALAGGIATAAVAAAVAAPPAWLIVAATLLAGKLAETGIAAFCEGWAEARAKSGKTSPGAPPKA
jgi:hypothetical protein